MLWVIVYRIDGWAFIAIVWQWVNCFVYSCFLPEVESTPTSMVLRPVLPCLLDLFHFLFFFWPWVSSLLYYWFTLFLAQFASLPPSSFPTPGIRPFDLCCWYRLHLLWKKEAIGDLPNHGPCCILMSRQHAFVCGVNYGILSFCSSLFLWTAKAKGGKARSKMKPQLTIHPSVFFKPLLSQS